MEESRGRQAVRRLHALLKERLLNADAGAVQRLETAIGKRPGWLRDRRRHNAIETGQLLDVLDHLGLDPARIIRQAWGSSVDRPPGKPPAVVRLARDRLAEGAQVGGQVGRSYLEKLDRLRYEDPRRAVELAELAVTLVEAELLPGLLGVAASAYRIRVELDLAEHAILAGLEIARARGDRLAEGDLLQRLAYIVGDRGDHAGALEIAERATGIYLAAGDPAGVGRTLFTQGMMLQYLDRIQSAIDAQKAALQHLPESEQRHRFSALQNLGFGYLALGDLERAGRYAQKAREISGGVGPWLRGKLIWLQASICVELEQLEQAEEYLREVLATFRPISLLDTLLATTDLVRVQLLQGDVADAHEIAKTTLEFLTPLGKNRLATAAIADLLRSGCSGLTIALVEEVRSKIEKAREHALGGSLEVRPVSQVI